MDSITKARRDYERKNRTTLTERERNLFIAAYTAGRDDFRNPIIKLIDEQKAKQKHSEVSG